MDNLSVRYSYSLSSQRIQKEGGVRTRGEVHIQRPHYKSFEEKVEAQIEQLGKKSKKHNKTCANYITTLPE